MLAEAVVGVGVFRSAVMSGANFSQRSSSCQKTKTLFPVAPLGDFLRKRQSPHPFSAIITALFGSSFRKGESSAGTMLRSQSPSSHCSVHPPSLMKEASASGNSAAIDAASVNKLSRGSTGNREPQGLPLNIAQFAYMVNTGFYWRIPK